MIYAVGDVHGQLDKLRATMERIERDGSGAEPVFFVGDLIDKGPDSRGVVEFVMQGQRDGRDWRVVRGNHDNKLPRFLDDPFWIDPGASEPLTWLGDRSSGAGATLRSYGIEDAHDRDPRVVHAEALAAIPPAQVAWLDSLPLWLLHEAGYLFVHAGIRPGVDLVEQAAVDLLNIRAAFREDRRDHGALVIHGHTPVRAVTHYGNRVNLDTNAADGGPLSAVRLHEGRVWLLTEGGAEALTPVEPTPQRLSALRSGAKAATR